MYPFASITCESNENFYYQFSTKPKELSSALRAEFSEILIIYGQLIPEKQGKTKYKIYLGVNVTESKRWLLILLSSSAI